MLKERLLMRVRLLPVRRIWYLSNCCDSHTFYFWKLIYLFIYLLFYGCSHDMQKFLGQGLKPHCSSDSRCCSDNCWILNLRSHQGTPENLLKEAIWQKDQTGHIRKCAVVLDVLFSRVWEKPYLKFTTCKNVSFQFQWNLKDNHPLNFWVLPKWS